MINSLPLQPIIENKDFIKDLETTLQGFFTPHLPHLKFYISGEEIYCDEVFNCECLLTMFVFNQNDLIEEFTNYFNKKHTTHFFSRFIFIENEALLINVEPVFISNLHQQKMVTDTHTIEHTYYQELLLLLIKSILTQQNFSFNNHIIYLDSFYQKFYEIFTKRISTEKLFFNEKKEALDYLIHVNDITMTK